MHMGDWSWHSLTK